MRREIKFREYNKEMVYISDFYYFEEQGYRTIDDVPTLMQFTGLKDKNGKEIYEGDIVKMIDVEEDIERIGFVDFGTGSFFIKCEFVSCYRWMDYEVEIIGNIYENPELLKK